MYNGVKGLEVFVKDNFHHHLMKNQSKVFWKYVYTYVHVA